MNRAELVQRMKANTDLPAGEVDWFVRTFFDSIAAGLVADGRVELRGFGVFQLKTRAQADFVNPKDGRLYPGGRINVVGFSPTARARGWEDVETVARDRDPGARS